MALPALLAVGGLGAAVVYFNRSASDAAARREGAALDAAAGAGLGAMGAPTPVSNHIASTNVLPEGYKGLLQHVDSIPWAAGMWRHQYKNPVTGASVYQQSSQPASFGFGGLSL